MAKMPERTPEEQLYDLYNKAQAPFGYFVIGLKVGVKTKNGKKIIRAYPPERHGARNND